MNDGIKEQPYGSPISLYRTRYDAEQGAAKVRGEAVVIGTTDDISYQKARGIGAGTRLDVTDLVLKVPVVFGANSATQNVSSGALMLQVPDGTIRNGNTRGVGAIDLQAIRTLATQVASGDYSIVIGKANIASGNYSTAAGYNNTATNTSSLAVGYNNTSSGINSTALGSTNVASGGASTAVGYNNMTTGVSSTAIGDTNTSAGQNSVALGFTTKSSGKNSFTVGYMTNARNIMGSFYSGVSTNTATVYLQESKIVLRAYTTTNAAVIATTTNSGAIATTTYATNALVIPINSSVIFTAKAIAKTATLGAIANIQAFEVKGILSCGATVGTTIVSANAVTAIGSGTLGVTFAVAADTTNGALLCNCTGIAATNINWCIVVTSSEIINL
jgi:Head domain of trimeric autotransporter adhesin